MDDSGGEREWVVAAQGVGNVPGQQFLDAIDRVIGDALDHVAQVRLGSKPLSLAAPIRPSGAALPQVFLMHR